MMSNDFPSTDSVATDSVIELRVPGRVVHASTVRLVAASMAADAGFTVDHVDDVRLAVNEVFTCAAAGSPDGTVVVQFEIGATDLVVRVSVLDRRLPIALDDLAQSIIRSAVDDVRVDGPTLTLIKHRHQTPPDDR
jgi:anti-sigma regulatory factor (Ser/Thr protein kinase)